MNALTDPFLRRPVLAAAIAIVIALAGLRALLDLPVRQYPKVEAAVISVTTVHPGASAETMQGFVTAPLAQAVATAEGIDYLTSSSTPGRSVIQAFLRLNADSVAAMTEVMAKASEVRYRLPEGAYDPVVQRQAPGAVGVIYIGVTGGALGLRAVTDFLDRVARPRLSAIPGVAQVNILGGEMPAMRIWLDPLRLASRDVTAAEAAAAIRANNHQAAAGQLRGAAVAAPIDAGTDVVDVEGFRRLVLRAEAGAVVRLADVAEVEVGATRREQAATMDGEPAVYLEVMASPGGNPVEIVRSVRAALGELRPALPDGARLAVPYDVTIFIAAALDQVRVTLLEAVAIVTVVIFLFLGSFRAVLVPLVAIPLSLLGTFALMAAAGFSINLLTLLAMVLAIGLVVDDAIIVVENVHRRIEQGEPASLAALHGAREIAAPVVAMTLTLAAVYAPIGLLGGLTGALFLEFAFTLAAAVLVSGVVALTLSPLMCAWLLRPGSGRLAHAVEHGSEALAAGYAVILRAVLHHRWAAVAFGLGVLAALPVLWRGIPPELAPLEDQGEVMIDFRARQSASLEGTLAEARRAEAALLGLPEGATTYLIVGGVLGSARGFGGALLRPWEERERDARTLVAEVQDGLGQAEGLAASAFLPPSLPGSPGGFPVQLAVSSPGQHRGVFEAMERLKRRAEASGLFAYVGSDLAFDSPSVSLRIDRAKAADLGLRMADIGETIGLLVGEDYLNRHRRDGRAYEVIAQVPQALRQTPDGLAMFHLRGAGGAQFPLATVATTEARVEANALTQFDQLNSATFQGVPAPGVTVGEAVAFLQAAAAEELPGSFRHEFLGEARQYLEEGNQLAMALAAAMVAILLVLAVQFGSLRDATLVLLTVPLAASGALGALWLGLGTLNIYTQIGLVTLIGLITKHGILIVEFANAARRRGLDTGPAALEAARLRLRPILMTTAAMVVGLLPLLISGGAGSGARFAIGVTLVAGLLFGTLFTLFVLPAAYATFAASPAPRRDEAASEADVTP